MDEEKSPKKKITLRNLGGDGIFTWEFQTFLYIAANPAIERQIDART